MAQVRQDATVPLLLLRKTPTPAATAATAATEPAEAARGAVCVPQLGLGTMALQGALCTRTVATALGMGYRLIDTASMYGNERDVGAAIAQAGVPREQLTVISKLRPEDMGYEEALRACEASCEALGLTHLDIYLVHAPGGSRRRRLESWRAMEELLSSGRCRAIGVRGQP
jgi:2,5-diketo-D-gluconate reductase A